MNTENLLAAIKGLDPQSPCRDLGNILSIMVISEDEIIKARARHPGHSGEIWRSFNLLCPSVHVRDAPEPIYRAHCAEILDRVAQGLDTTLGTRAEVMMGLSATSLKAPLTHTAAVLYAQLFRDILPESSISDDLETLSTMAFDQTTGALWAELSKKCRDPKRKLARGR